MSPFTHWINIWLQSASSVPRVSDSGREQSVRGEWFDGAADAARIFVGVVCLCVGEDTNVSGATGNANDQREVSDVGARTF